MRACMPREIMSHTWAPSTSAQVRTQRVHRMQRFVVEDEAGMRQVHRQAGEIVGKGDAGDPHRIGHLLQLAIRLEHAPRTHGCVPPEAVRWWWRR